jgi:hypothetical protein
VSWGQSSFPLRTIVTQSLKWHGQIVVVPRRAFDHFVVFHIDPPDRVPATVYDQPGPLAWRPRFQMPRSGVSSLLQPEFDSRERLPTRCVRRPLILFSFSLLCIFRGMIGTHPTLARQDCVRFSALRLASWPRTCRSKAPVHSLRLDAVPFFSFSCCSFALTTDNVGGMVGAGMIIDTYICHRTCISIANALGL